MTPGHFRVVACLITLVTGALSPAQAQSETGRSSQGADSAAVARLEQAVEDALVRRDVAFLDSVYAPSFRFKHSTGMLETRDQRMADVRRAVPANAPGRMIARVVDSLDVEVHGDVALTTGRIHVRRDGGDPQWQDYTVRYARIWARSAGRWQLATHHSTGESQGPPPPNPPRVAVQAAGTQTPALDAFTDKFDRYVRESSILGGSYALVRDGRVYAAHSVGYADLAARQMVDSNTMYQYGSITKTLAAITVLQLRDRGKLSLDDPATKYLPELRRVYDPFGSPDSITIRMLLSHTAGFQNPTWPWTNGEAWEPFEPTTWDQLVGMLPYQKLAFKPGTRWSYSNPAFIYLARIVEEITGEPWLTYVQKNVFAPLGMTRSYFSATPYHLAAYRSNNYTIKKDSATGRIDTVANGRDFDPGITNPNGGWNAPLSDVAKWIAFLLDPARDERILTRRSWEEIRRQVMATSASTADRPEYIGLTFFLLPRGGTTYVGHTGSQNGFTAFLFLDPATRTGIIAAFNTANPFAPPGAYKELYESSLPLISGR